MLPLPWWKWSYLIKLLLSGWSQQRIMAYSGGDSQCQSLLLAGWAIRSSCNQVRIGEWKSSLLRSCITIILLPWLLFCHEPNAKKYWSSWVKRTTNGYKSTIHLIIKILLSQGLLFGEHSHGAHIFLYSVHSEKSVHTSLPSCHHFPNHVPFKPLTIKTKPLAIAHDSVYTYVPLEKWTTRILLKFLPIGRIFVHPCLSGLSQNGCVMGFRAIVL